MATPEAVEFAALLKDLKDRSGRSYGVLAGKLHVSTSTLHRYCNGDAVPNEFAPVERFARVCGASGDELVEVHRRWIVADAARRRPLRRLRIRRRRRPRLRLPLRLCPLMCLTPRPTPCLPPFLMAWRPVSRRSRPS